MRFEKQSNNLKVKFKVKEFLHQILLIPKKAILYWKTGYFPINRSKFVNIFDLELRERDLLQIKEDINFLNRRIKNVSYNISSNGEKALVNEILLDQKQPVVFDIGANVGDWSRMVRDVNPNALLYCFEISQKTFKELSEGDWIDDRVHLYDFGLSDKDEKIKIKSFANNKLTSAVNFPHSDPFEWVDAQVKIGDSFVRQIGIEKIDFMKIDVEGLEPAVLRGFSDMLSRKAVSVIQFEYGKANIYTGDLLKDIYDQLTLCGYKIGKLYPYGVEIKDYSPEDEDFFGPNYVAFQSL